MRDWQRNTPFNPRGETVYLFKAQEAFLTALKGFADTRLFCNFVARQSARPQPFRRLYY